MNNKFLIFLILFIAPIFLTFFSGMTAASLYVGNHKEASYVALVVFIVSGLWSVAMAVAGSSDEQDWSK